MGMRIRTNVSSLTAQRFMSQNNKSMNDSVDKLASGYRINKSADDAAGLAISENLRGKIRGMGVAKRNANDAISMVQVAEGTMNEMTNILIRLRELTVQASSDTIGDKERGFLNREYTQLVDEMDRTAIVTEFNGIKLFDKENDKTEFVIQVGTNSEDSDTDPNTIKVDIEGLKFDSEKLGLSNEAEIGPESGEDTGPSREDISAKLGTLDDALGKIASERATIGAIQNRLGSSIANLGVSIENSMVAKSRIKDVDFASETANLAQARIMRSSNVSVLAQANQAPEMALQLLR
jgi:flagellin